mgnify:CR=1 FL=1
MKKENLNGIAAVRLSDYSNYDCNLCNNGGKYGFWTDYDLIGNDLWEVSYHTTSDFEYCPVCGTFGDCNCEDGDYRQITTSELLEEISRFEKLQEANNDTYSYRIEYFK